MVNAPKTNFSTRPVGRYGKSTKRSTQQRHQVNEGKSGREAERVRAHLELRSLRSKKKLAAEKRPEIHFLSNEEEKKWIEDYVERQTAGATKRVEDAEAAVQQEQEDMKHAEIVGFTSREHKNTFNGMMVAIGDSVSGLATSDDGEDRDDQDDDESAQGTLSEDDEPSWVMRTFTKTLQQRMERFQQKLMNLNELT